MSDLERIARDRFPVSKVRASPAVRPAAPPPTRHGYRPAAGVVRPGLDARVRVVPRASAPASRRFAEWRRDHYVADQALRVGVLLAVAVAVLLVLAAVVILALRWVVGAASGIPAGSALGVLGVVLVGAGLLAGRRSGPGGHAGHGWHYGKCRR